MIYLLGLMNFLFFFQNIKQNKIIRNKIKNIKKKLPKSFKLTNFSKYIIARINL